MAMLHWFEHNIDKSKFYVVNIEHGIRGAESLRDSAFVCAHCQNSEVFCLSKSVNATEYAKSHKMPLEQAARLLRHEIFAQEAMTTADYVALAHHKSDQVETIFMHIARGSGINGLCGMSEVDGHILRPLLTVDKKEIMQYIMDNNIQYLDDTTNCDNAYNRNYTRNVILPTIEKAYPQFCESLVKLGARADEAMKFICSHLPQLEASDGCCIVDIAALPTVVAKVAIQRAATLVGVAADIEEKHLTACLALVLQTNGSRLMLPHNLRAYNENGLLALTTNMETDEQTHPFALSRFDFIYGDFFIIGGNCSSNVTSLIDMDKLPKNAVIRTARPQDKITLSYGSKSLGNYFTDKKIPKRLRGCLPIIACGSTVVAIADWAVGADFAADSTTKNYIEIHYVQKDKIYE